MLRTRSFEEIRVYDGVATRTGVLFERNDVRHSDACCTSVRDLIHKVRASGDGTFYLRVNAWPLGADHVELQKLWVVMS